MTGRQENLKNIPKGTQLHMRQELTHIFCNERVELRNHYRNSVATVFTKLNSKKSRLRIADITIGFLNDGPKRAKQWIHYETK